jgi:hypothetical protein
VSERTGWSRILEFVGQGAVVVSLVYVGVQVRQNTAAIQTSTSQEVYQQNQEQALLLMESAEMAAILLQANQDLSGLSPTDSIRYGRYLNVTLNLYEAVYANALQGTMEAEMAAGWLADMSDLRCTPGMAAYWGGRRDSYHQGFRAALDSAFAVSECSR